jgi:anaerobic magnesium-protoporphyrin IX monomethyl ester cyclase
VVDEIVHLTETYRPDHLWFADDIVGLKPGWISEFADLMNKHDVVTGFNALSRPDLMVKGDTAEQFGRAGAEFVWIGAESGSQAVLDAMEKGTKVSQIVEAADRVHAAGYKIAFFLQFGYPGEGLDEIEETLQLIWRARPDDIGASVSYPLPGTSFHERVVEQLGDTRNWRDSDDLAMLFEGPYSTEFYRELHQRLHLEYRARRIWWRVRAGERPPLREALSAIKGLLQLPAAKRRVRRLAVESADRIGTLPVTLSPDDAAVPSSQSLPIPTRRDSSKSTP